MSRGKILSFQTCGHASTRQNHKTQIPGPVLLNLHQIFKLSLVNEIYTMGKWENDDKLLLTMHIYEL